MVDWFFRCGATTVTKLQTLTIQILMIQSPRGRFLWEVELYDSLCSQLLSEMCFYIMFNLVLHQKHFLGRKF